MHNLWNEVNSHFISILELIVRTYFLNHDLSISTLRVTRQYLHVPTLVNVGGEAEGVILVVIHLNDFFQFIIIYAKAKAKTRSRADRFVEDPI